MYKTIGETFLFKCDLFATKFLKIRYNVEFLDMSDCNASGMSRNSFPTSIVFYQFPVSGNLDSIMFILYSFFYFSVVNESKALRLQNVDSDIMSTKTGVFFLRFPVSGILN